MIIEVMNGDKPPPAQPTVMVCCIGQHFLPGVLEAANRALRYAGSQGHGGILNVILDICVGDAMGVGDMRDMAAVAALNERADYMLMLENDVVLAEDALTRLLALGRPVVTPYLWPAYAPGHGKHGIGLGDSCPPTLEKGDEIVRTSDPMVYPKQGLVPLRWHVMSCLLWSTAVFRHLGPRIFHHSAPVTNYEQTLFDYLRSQGYTLWQDTDTRVDLLRPPGSPEPRKALGTMGMGPGPVKLARSL